MGKKMNMAKSCVKLLGSASVQMMIGGLVKAVIPPEVSIIYKAGAYVGSCVVALCASDPIDRAVDKQFVTIEALVEETRKNIDILKQEYPDEELDFEDPENIKKYAEFVAKMKREEKKSKH